jgi:chemotaxis signal transduction protein
MKEPEETGAKFPPPTHAQRETRELFTLRAGGRLFAVLAEETDGVAEGLSPAPLPHAPAAVLGVVSVRGRMRTVLYPPALTRHSSTVAADSSTVTADSSAADATAITADSSTVAAAAPRFVVALRGEEQLALAADALEGTFSTDAESLAPAEASDAPLLATLERGDAIIQVLDTSLIFDAAMQGTERRRPRA